MKNVIGKMHINASTTNLKSLRLYFPKKIVAILGNSIVLDIEKLTIRRAEIDDQKTFNIGKLHTSINPEKDISEYVGRYEVIQKNEDKFKLKKISDELCGSNRLGKGRCRTQV